MNLESLTNLHTELADASDSEFEGVNDEAFSIMDGYEAVLRAEYERHERRRNRCLTAARKVMYRRHYQALMAEIEETSTHGFKITKKRDKGRRDTSRQGGLAVWCDQYVNGGMEGDSFAGQIWVQLDKRHFLTFHYSE